jgi:hypothetical protein
MLIRTKLALSYAAFAAIATVANIGAQDLVVQAYGGRYSILASVVIGTVVGLIVKYNLDKRYIFGFRTKSIAHDTQTFILYTLMGVVTTAIFWGFEFGFNAVFAGKEMRYAGAILGLAIGYIAKYQLDRRYVFNTH